MNKHVYDTNSGPIIQAITEGKTVIVFLFSNLDSSFYNIHAVLPSLNEASAIHSLYANQPDWDWDIEMSMIHKYIPIYEEQNWLQTQAPAGLAASVCQSLLSCAFPQDAEEIQTLLNITRGTTNIYDQIKSFVSYSNGSYEDVKNCDIFKLMKMAIAAEPFLQREGILEEGFKLTKVSNQSKAANIKPGTIDTKSENAELRKQGFD